jgi:F-type H+-transporting ATPase subunit c
MKSLKMAAVVLGLLFAAQAPVVAQQYTPANANEAAQIAYAQQARHGWSDLRPVGVGLIIIGAGIGIGWLARAAVESMARQPEVAPNIQTAMIIAAALIEGVTFFALIILMLFASPWK